MLLRIYDMVRPLIFGLVICFLNLVFILHPAYADKVLWEFKVPVKLENMPEEVESVVIEWSLYSGPSGNGDLLAEDSVVISLNSKGKLPTKETITIYESPVDDPAKPQSIVFFF